MNIFGNPDQAKSRNDVMVESELDGHQLRLFMDAAELLATTQREVAKMLQQTEGKAAVYEGSQFQLPQDQPYPILGFDLSRLKAIVTANVAGVTIGHASEVNAASGFPLIPNANMTLLTTDAVYAMYHPATGTGQVATIGVWLEKAAI